MIVVPTIVFTTPTIMNFINVLSVNSSILFLIDIQFSHHHKYYLMKAILQTVPFLLSLVAVTTI